MTDIKKLIQMGSGIIYSIFHSGVKFPTFIGKSVALGDNLNIDRLCVIGSDLRIEKNGSNPIRLGNTINIDKNTRIKTGKDSNIAFGDNTKIGNNSLIYSNNNSKIEILHNNKIGQNTKIKSDKNSKIIINSDFSIGENSTLAAKGNSTISIDDSVSIGDNCQIVATNGSEYTIDKNASINNNSKVLSPETGGGNLSIGKKAVIHSNNFLDLTGDIIIKSQARTSRDVFIHTHNHGIADTKLIWNQPLESKSVFIGEGAWIGTRAQLLPGSKLKEGSVLGAGSILTQATSKYKVYGGVPATLIKDRRDIN